MSNGRKTEVFSWHWNWWPLSTGVENLLRKVKKLNLNFWVHKIKCQNTEDKNNGA